MSEMPLTISENAARQLHKVLAEEAGAALRISVEGGVFADGERHLAHVAFRG